MTHICRSKNASFFNVQILVFQNKKKEQSSCLNLAATITNNLGFLALPKTYLQPRILNIFHSSWLNIFQIFSPTTPKTYIFLAEKGLTPPPPP